VNLLRLSGVSQKLFPMDSGSWLYALSSLNLTPGSFLISPFSLTRWHSPLCLPQIAQYQRSLASSVLRVCQFVRKQSKNTIGLAVHVMPGFIFKKAWVLPVTKPYLFCIACNYGTLGFAGAVGFLVTLDPLALLSPEDFLAAGEAFAFLPLS